MQELISVIVPVYNAEKYLKDCIDSILAQSYKNIEVICVDDGSADKSSSICDEYTEKDSRVRVIHKENGGVSSARNCGLDAARGAYVTFVDSDDYIATDYVEKLYTCISDGYNVDIAMCRCVFVTGDSLNPYVECLPDDVYLTSTDSNYINFLIRFLKFKKPIFGSSWKILWRKSCVEKIRFNTAIIASEDLLFVLSSFKYASHLKSIDYYGYFYRIHGSSITKKYKKSYLTSQITLYNELKSFANEINDNNFSKALDTYGALLAYYAFSNELKFRSKERRNNIATIRRSELYPYFKLSKGMRIDNSNKRVKFLIAWILVKSRLV